MIDQIADSITVGILAGISQLIGYILYWRLVVTAEDKLPNPLTWFMFGYGTLVLTILEFDVGATWGELYLPMICSISGFGVAVFIWWSSFKTTKRYWPREWNVRHVEFWDGLSLLLDIIVTLCYVVAWGIFTWGALDTVNRHIALLMFLLFSNISTIFNFVPILRDTRLHPDHEHWLPWVVWTFSYSLLTIETWFHEDVVVPTFNWVSGSGGIYELSAYILLWIETWDPSFTDWIWLLVYPISNLCFHAWVAILARPARQLHMTKNTQ